MIHLLTILFVILVLLGFSIFILGITIIPSIFMYFFIPTVFSEIKNHFYKIHIAG